ncbi:MAG: Ig domain-containing protein [Bryobacteraceae bacterium]
MKLFFLLLLLAVSLAAQTTVYVRASGPAAVQVTGTGNTTPETIQTATAHGYSAGNVIVIGGVCTGSTASPVNGIMVVHSVTDTTHFTIYSLSGTPIATNGPWASCATGSNPENWKWTGLLTSETLSTTLPTLNFNSSIMQKFSLGTSNGLTSITATGCPSACVLTVATSFDPTAMQIPVAAGQGFSVWNTTSTGINTAGTGTTGTPWTVASVSSTGWVSSPVAVGGATNQAYTTNNACGPKATPDGTIGGTQNCVRLSFIALTTNPFWSQIVTTQAGGGNANWYRMLWDGGGTILPNFYNLQSTTQYWIGSVYQFLVDQSNTMAKSVLSYAMTHATDILGVNFFLDETQSGGATGAGGNYLPGDMLNFGLIYQVDSPYESSSVSATFRSQLLNDLDDPTQTACNNTDANATAAGHRDIVAGPATARAGSTTSITLNAGDSHVDSYYVNNVVEWASTNCYSGACFGLVTAYVSATKVATIGGGWQNVSSGPVQPASGTSYTISSGITMTGGGSSEGNTGTVTGYNTHFTTMLHVGDQMVAGLAFPQSQTVETSALYVSNIASDTSATVVGYNFTGASGVYYMPAWKAGDCGFVWYDKHYTVFPNSEPTLYPPDAGVDLAGVNGGTLVGDNLLASTGASYTALGIALAPDDSRAVRLLAMMQSFAFDYSLQQDMHSWTGLGGHGSYYSYVTDGASLPQYAAIIANSIPSYPSQDLSGPWVMQDSIYKIFSSYPDYSFWGSPDNMAYNGVTHEAFIAPWGAEVQSEPKIAQAWPYLNDPIFLTNPTLTQAQMLKYWLQGSGGLSSVNFYSGTNSGGWWGAPSSLLYTDPRIGSTTFATLPHQYLFKQSSSTVCAALTGWLCPANQTNAYVYSRTGWTSKADGLLQYISATYFVTDHDSPHQGTIRYYKVGPLLNGDQSPPGFGPSYYDPQALEWVTGSMLQIGSLSGAATTYPAYQPTIPASGAAPIIRWSSANAGSLGAYYGDQHSNYACATSDLTGAYPTSTFNYAQRTMCHSKPSGGDEFIIQHDAVSLLSAQSVTAHIHYPQNGEEFVSTYPEGNTTCPGSGGCGLLNATRWIQELEDGGTAVNVLTSGTYVSGISPVGTLGQTCNLTILGSAYGSGDDATATVALTGTNAILTGTALTITNGGSHYAFAPTSASVSSGTATCSGTAIVTADGGANDDPARTYGLVTRILTPISGTVAWACPLGGGPGGSDECQTTSTYSGGEGHTDRVDICGGASCGSSVSTFEDLVVHKVAQSISDTALTTTAITPDSNWSGVQACGSTSCMVYVGARAGIPQSTMTGFTTSHSGTAQYLIAGLAAGTYQVTVGRNPVLGGTTVSDGDNTLYFESTAGAVVITSGSQACSISTTTLPPGVVGMPYSTTLQTVSCTAPVSWSVTGGTLCNGLALDSGTGILSGTPSAPQNCSFTVQASDSAGNTPTQSLAQVVWAIQPFSTPGTIIRH